MNTPHFDAAMGYRGRLEGPYILAECWQTMPAAERPYALAQAWCMAERPERALGARCWVGLFRSVGFVSEAGQPAPLEPLQLYRGATWGYRRGMAWTTDLAIARKFAKRFGVFDGDVFGAVVEPAGVLAYIDDTRQGSESEVLIDPAYLPPIRRASIIPPTPVL